MEPERRERLLTFIDNYWAEHWTSPTIREIGKFMGWSSPATSHDAISRLVKNGYLEVRRTGNRVLYRSRWKNR